MLRMSKLFSRTLREDPSDAENRGHRLLVRAGYVRRAGSGAFTFLPLGWAVYRNVERIVREEMERAGFQEVHFPALLPREPFERSGRWQDYGDSLFRLKDRRGSDHLLAPTHEEFFTMLVKDICSSWKDLPTSIFQIQTKFRDEARPRGGLLRGREFVMKDSYSFDLDDAGLAVSYQRHRDAYQRTFDRLGLDYVIVSAMSGAMGGSVSEEFLCPMEVGEDTFVRCPSCGYAANTEAVQTPVPGAVASDGRPAAHVEDTPRTPTIDTLVDHLNDTEGLRRTDRPWAAGDLLKNVVFRVRHPDATTELVAVGLPGDRAVDPKRLEAQLSPSVVEGVPDEVLAATPGVVLGYIGPGALGASSPSGIRYLLDPRIVPGTAWVTGANEPGRHVLDLVAGRDFEADGVVDAAEVRAGDACPSCGTGLAIERGIEIGHIFQLGRTYAEAFGLVVQGPDKEPATVTMGSYGIGVTRLVGALAETTADDKGLCWPVGVGPADVHVVVAAKGDEHIAAAERLAESAEAAGLRVLLDDRAVSPGVKFADAELLGVPWIVVVGRALARGEVEVRDRRSATAEEVPIAGALAPIAEQRVAVG